jgi:hypothetical protein
VLLSVDFLELLQSDNEKARKSSKTKFGFIVVCLYIVVKLLQRSDNYQNTRTKVLCDH